MHIFFLQIRDFRMATKADADRVCLGQSGLRARVWAMAIETFASLRSQMRRFRGLDPLDLLSMARHAKRLRVSLCQDDLAILRGRVADFALSLGERWMRELRHQLRSRRLVRIMTAQAVSGREGLILMRLLQLNVFRIMAIQAKRRSRLREMKLVLWSRFGPGLVRRVASVAAHVKRSMAASLGQHYRSLCMAS